MKITQEPLDKIKEEMVELANLSERITAETTLEEWHKKLLKGLAYAGAKSAYHALQVASLPPALDVHLNYCPAWATRGVYEARVCVRFCLTKDNAAQFMADQVRDAEEVIQGFMTFGDMLHADALQQIKNHRKVLGETRARMPEGEYPKIDIGKIAAKYPDLRKEHKSMYKVLSKLTHVTALSVMMSGDDAQLGIILSSLATYVLACLLDISSHVRMVLGTGK